MPVFLPVLFALVALIYAAAGFGGGSTYTALLAAVGTDYAVLPMISLACNIVVVTGGVIQFARAGAVRWRKVLPMIALSMPAAWAGGMLQIPETAFLGLLGGALLAASIALLMRPDRPEGARVELPRGVISALSIGIGFLSGLVGIGGGIFLAPALHLVRWERARVIAATASLYILCNSAAGLLGQVQKNADAFAGATMTYWPLLVAVVIGGQIGSRLGASILPDIWVRRVTAALVFVVALRLLISVGRQVFFGS